MENDLQNFQNFRKFWVGKSIFDEKFPVLKKFEANSGTKQKSFRFNGVKSVNKFLAEKLFVVSRGTEIVLAYFLRKLLRSENFKSICSANGDYVSQSEWGSTIELVQVKLR